MTGEGEPGAEVIVKDSEGTVVGEGTVNEEGNFEVELDKPFTNGEELEVSQKDQAKNESESAKVNAPDTTAPNAPTDVEVSEDGSKVIGKGEPSAEVIVKDANDNVVGKGTVNEDGRFEVELDKPFTNGEELEVSLKDEAGNESDSTSVNAPDTTAPNAPDAEIDEDGLVVKGKAEPGSTVEIKDQEGNSLGSVVADPESGAYEVELSRPVTDGETVDVTATDEAGNTSEKTPVTGEKDTVAPDAPTAEIDEEGLVVKGKTEAGSTVEVTDSNGEVIGSGTANEQGEYEVELSRPVTDGETVDVTATDEAGNTSEKTPVTGEKDTIAPEAPDAEIDEDGLVVKGKAEPGSTVEIKDQEGNSLGSVVADPESGAYEVELSRPVTDGETVDVTATDKAGNTSEKTPVTGEKDTVAPDAPTAEIDEEGLVVKGKTEAGSTVEVTDSNGEVIGSGTANEQGEYEVELSRPVTDGETVDVTATDKAGNTSEKTLVTGEKDTVAPDAPTAEIDEDGLVVKGKAEPGSTVEIKDQEGNSLGSVVADPESGEYEITLDRPVTDGETVNVTATDKAGNTSEKTPVTGEKDTVAPDAPTAEIDEEGLVVKGKTEAGSTVEVTDSNGEVIGSGTANEQGEYEVELSRPVTDGETVDVTATDEAGNTSEKTPVTGEKDTIAPEAPDAEIDEDGLVVKGKAEPGSTVEIKDQEGNSLGSVVADSESGAYEVELSRPVTDGETVDVTATDEAGNTSEKTPVTGEKDTVAPNAPTAEIDEEGLVVKGKAEPGSTVEIKDQEGNSLGSVVADPESGEYEITLDRPVTDGETVDVTATDEAGNTSEKTPVTGEKDTIAPDAPTAEIDEEGLVVKGKAEPGSTVEIKDQEGNSLGSVVADPESGEYEITLDRPVTDGETVDVTATDEAGNTSEKTPVTGEKDTVAPDAPTAEIDEEGLVVTGNAEPGSTVEVKDQEGNSLGSVVADPESGEYEITLDRPVTDGETVNVTATDKAGNTSEKTPVTGEKDTVAPDAPTAEIDEEGLVVKGKTEAGSTVEVTDSNGEVIGSGTANEQGEYEVELSRPVTDGETVDVTATDKAGNTSEKTPVIGEKDTIAPEAPDAEIDEDGLVVKGKAEPGSTVEIKDQEGNSLGSVVADPESGAYEVELSRPVTDGETVNVTATDKAGNTSDKTPVTGEKDTTAPNAPTDVEVSEDGSKVIGKGEPGAEVIVKDANDNVVGKGTVNEDGRFEVELDKPFTNGEELEVSLKDEAGNESDSTSVNAPDTTAPNAPTAEIDEDGLVVKGKAEPGSTVEIKDQEGNSLGSVVADPESGAYEVELSRPVTDGETVDVTATDEAGNTSEKTPVTGEKDTIAPDAPTAEIDEDGLVVKGKAEPGSTVEIKDQEGNSLGSVVADPESGAYEVELSRP
ncbi:Ig-like domain repeat protein, partial [Ignatzschineria cameli]